MGKARPLIWLASGALAGALGALTARAYLQYRREMAEMTTRLRAGSVMAETALGPVEYAETGDGPPVLVLHGGGGGYDQGLAVAKLLGPTRRWIAVSRFGYLRSPVLGDGSFATQADAYAALLDRLGLERVYVLGASAGGFGAQHFALRHPERCAGLLLGSTGSLPYPAFSASAAAMLQLLLHGNFAFWAMVRALPQPILAFTGATPAVQAQLTSAERQWLQDVLLTLLPISLRRDGLLNDLRQAANYSPPDLSQIKAPTLVIHARHDPIAPFEHGQFAANAIPGARLIVLEEGGHLGLMSTRGAMAEALRFLGGE